jgi:hypothetical protein
MWNVKGTFFGRGTGSGLVSTRRKGRVCVVRVVRERGRDEIWVTKQLYSSTVAVYEMRR